MTREDYEHLLASQDGRCAICGRKPSPVRRLHVDHEHSSGRIRGLLCAACNPALGLFRDSEELLIKAITYLRADYAGRNMNPESAK